MPPAPTEPETEPDTKVDTSADKNVDKIGDTNNVRRDRLAHQVRLAVKSDVAQMCDSLVDAFFDDPVSVWIYPDESLRHSQLSEWYVLSLVAGLHAGHTYTVSNNSAVAVWAPPSVPFLFEWDREGQAIAEMLGRQLGDRTGTVVKGLMTIETAHPRDVPHFYLSMLGTSPAMQGRGLAGALLDEVLTRCDREGWPAYLETSRERNVMFYSRRGFEVTGTEVVGGDGPQVWFMWREPAPQLS